MTRLPLPFVFASRVALVSALLAVPVLVVRAQSLDIGSGTGPIDITADNGIEWDSKAHTVNAEGHAIAKRGTMTVFADHLVAHYEPASASSASASPAAPAKPAKQATASSASGGDLGGAFGGGSMQIQELEAHGNVHITTPTQTADGNDATFDVIGGTMTMLGEPVHLTGTDQTVIADHRLDYDTKTLIATAKQGATVSQKGRTISAPIMIAHMVNADGKTTLDHADASGGVVVKTETETAYGSQGNYDAKTGIATLIGSVKILRGGDVFTGTKAIFNLNTGVSRLIGGGSGNRVTAVVTPQSSASSAAKVSK